MPENPPHTVAIVTILALGYALWMSIGIVWSIVLAGRIKSLASSRWRLFVCISLNTVLWPIGMVYRYRRIKRFQEGDGRIVF